MKNKCGSCRYYYVTWDQAMPHGCRAMKFKSKAFPSEVVVKSSGEECLLFEKKMSRQYREEHQKQRIG